MEQTQKSRWAHAIAATLRAERAAQDLTLEQLATRSGLSVSGVRRYERGERLPDMVQLATLAEALGMAPARMWAEIQARHDTDGA